MPKGNTASVARAGRACLAGFALVILSASLAEAEFGPRTTIGKNYQQTSTTTSLNGINAGACNGGAECYVLYQPIPQQKPLIVQHVSCRVSVDTGNLRYGVLRTRKDGTFPLKRTLLVPLQTIDWWTINNTAMHLIKPGERPIVYFANTNLTNWFVECNISGTLQQP